MESVTGVRRTGAVMVESGMVAALVTLSKVWGLLTAKAGGWVVIKVQEMRSK